MYRFIPTFATPNQIRNKIYRTMMYYLTTTTFTSMWITTLRG